MDFGIIEERYVGSAGGVTTRVWIEPDNDTKPPLDLSADDMAAWERGEWRYVEVSASDEDAGGRVTFVGIEYGKLPSRQIVIGMNEVIEDCLDDLRAELTAQ